MGAIDGQPIQARGHTFWPCLGTTWKTSGSLGAPVRVVLLSHAVSCVWTTHHYGVQASHTRRTVSSLSNPTPRQSHRKAPLENG